MIADQIIVNKEKIGGDNIIVEVDESKYGSRKFFKGHRVQGTWIIGGVERTPQKRFFAIAVEDRTTETIINILHENIEDGSIIYTDYWKSYDSAIDQINFEFFSNFKHQKVNHSEGFVAPDGTQMNSIEGTWNGTKCTKSSREKSQDRCPINVLTFIWRRQNKGNLREAFIESLKAVDFGDYE